MKLKKISIALLGAFSASAFAQVNCDNKNKPEFKNYVEMKVAQGFNDLPLMKKLDEKYCYDYSTNYKKFNNILFFTYNSEQAKFLIPKVPNFKKVTVTPETGWKRERDVLSHLLYTAHADFDTTDKQTVKELISVYKTYNPAVTEENFFQTPNYFSLNDKNYKDLLKTVEEVYLPHYKKTDLIRDSLGLNALDYAMAFDNSKVFLHFQPTGQDLVTPNGRASTLWHLAFADKSKRMTTEESKLEQAKINEYLLNTIKPVHWGFIVFGNPNAGTQVKYPFELFLYHYKHNNMELYNGLKKKFPQFFNTPDDILAKLPFDKEHVKELMDVQLINSNN